MKKIFLTTFALCFYTFIGTAQEEQQTSNGVKTTINAIDVEIEFYNSKTVRVFF